jgi:hypothetical protein
MADDEEIEEPESPDEEDLGDDSMPFSLDDEAEIADDEDDLDEDGGVIDLEVALAISDEANEADEGDDDASLADEVDDDDDDEDDQPIREGEFVCNGCHMVFRVTAMADTKAQLCRDCA